MRCAYHAQPSISQSDPLQPLENEPENDISLMAFRLLTKDLLDLFTAMNEAVMNILSQYIDVSTLLQTSDTQLHRPLFRALKTRRRTCHWNLQNLRKADRPSRPISQHCQTIRTHHQVGNPQDQTRSYESGQLTARVYRRSRLRDQQTPVPGRAASKVWQTNQILEISYFR